MARILLAGYLGAGNHGDDAMMLATAYRLEAAGHDLTVLSGHPDETYRLHGISAVPRRDRKQVAEAIQTTDALVFPGGSIFQDVTSVASNLYYAGLVRQAKKAGKRVALVGQGIGPLRTFLGKRLASRALHDADVLALRDPSSAEAVRALGVRRPITVTADSAFLLQPSAEEAAGEGFQVGNMRTVGVSARPLGKKVDVAGLFAEFCRLLYQSGTVPVLLEMDRQADRPLNDEIGKRNGGRVPDLRKVSTPQQIQARIARMDAVLAMRLHAGVLAASVAVPPMMVSYDPKVTAFARLLEVGPALPIEGLTPARLVESFQGFLRDRDRNAAIVARKRAELAKLAERNIELVLEMVADRAKMA